MNLIELTAWGSGAKVLVNVELLEYAWKGVRSPSGDATYLVFGANDLNGRDEIAVKESLDVIAYRSMVPWRVRFVWRVMRDYAKWVRCWLVKTYESRFRNKRA
jgi:hypothetical protein